MTQSTLYQSVLKKLSNTPVELLPEIDRFLSQINHTVNLSREKAENRKKILALAGSWSDMSNDDFQDYLRQAKQTGSELFDREIDL
jgi:hypothetical protein